MPFRLKRRIALLLLAALALAQMSVALASPCPMSEMAMDLPCDGCDTPLQAAHDDMASLCATHCATADQPAAAPAASSVPTSSEQAVLVFKRTEQREKPRGLDGPPAGAPPPRILLHSFLI